jgi:hypothetical protein
LGGGTVSSRADFKDLSSIFAPGRALAYGGLCKLMSRHHDQPFHEEYYYHFYRAMLKGLTDRDTSITFAIINNSTKLFAQGLPGCQILVHSFIEAIRSVLQKTDAHISEMTRQNAVTILCSLICLVGSNRIKDAGMQTPPILYRKLELGEGTLQELGRGGSDVC